MQLWEVQTVGGAIVGGAAVEGAITGVQLVAEAAGGWGVQLWGVQLWSVQLWGGRSCERRSFVGCSRENETNHCCAWFPAKQGTR